jgi:hypothetical protein
MPVIRLDLTSTLSAPELMQVLTDFSASCPGTWPTIDHDHFEVHALGDTWAEVTEGTASAWERARYEWDDARSRVTIATHDSIVMVRRAEVGEQRHYGGQRCRRGRVEERGWSRDIHE